MAFVKHGDLDDAAAKFQQANQKGPHWADPMCLQGNTKDALAKYDEALKYRRTGCSYTKRGMHWRSRRSNYGAPKPPFATDRNGVDCGHRNKF